MGNIGIFGTLQIAKQGLLVQQSSVAVTSHNLANVNTPGYSRQSPQITTMDSQLIGGIYFGRGAQLAAITKSYDKFLNNSIMLEKNILGRWEAQETLLAQAETIFNESGDEGLNALLTDFWNAWQDVADNPEGMAERAVLQRAGQTIAGTFQRMHTNLRQIQTNANNSIVNTVATINRLSQEIAKLNGQILGTESQGGNANDLTDQRSLKIEELSKLIDIRALEGKNGQITILTSFGKPLVAENISWQLSAVADPDNQGLYAVYFNDKDTKVNITEKITGGQLRGILEVRDEIVPSYVSRLNMLASSLVTEVNRMHYRGYGLDGSTGNYFFNPVPIDLQEGGKNRGDLRIYDARVIDPAALESSTYKLRFLNAASTASRYEIYDELNNQNVYRIDAGNASIVVDDGSGDRIVTLSHGAYTGDELAAEVERQLDSNATAGQDYTVSYNQSLRKFTITNSGIAAVDFKWGSPDATAADVLGFADTFTITQGINDTVSFDDGTGGAAETATLAAGTYTGNALADALKQSLEAAGDAEVTVTYDAAGRAFTVTVNSAAAPQNNVDFFWLASNAAATLGFTADTLDVAVDDQDTSDVAPALPIAAGASATSPFSGGTYEYAAQHIEIVSGANDTIVFRDDGTLTYRTATLSQGTYTTDTLADEIKRQLEASSGAGQTYTVTFNNATQQFTILNSATNANNLDLLWARSGAAATLGFDSTNSLAIATGSAESSDTSRYRERNFEVVAGFNSIVFDDGGVGGPVTATLSVGRYTGEELAAEIERQLESTVGSSGQDYSVTFDSRNGVFTIINNNGNLHATDFDWTTSTAAALLGFTAAATPPVAAGAFMRSDNPPVGNIATYDTIEFSGLSVRISDAGSLPVTGDYCTISTVTDAAITMAMDTVTVADPEKIAAALAGFDIDGSNNTIIFDDDGTPGSFAYTVVIPSGRYTPDELAAEIERQLEQNGSGQSYAVTFDAATQKFTIASNPGNANELFLLWENPNTTAEFTLGYRDTIFEITAGVNDDIDFNEGAGALTAYLRPGLYTGEELAAEVQKQLEAQGDGTYAVTYNNDRTFTITSDSANTTNLTLSWSTSGTAAELGFNAVDTAGITPGSSDTSDLNFGGLAAGATLVSDFTTDGSQVGDNRNALNLAGLQDIAVLDQGTLTIGSYYSLLVGQVGSDVEETNNALDHQQFMIEQYEQRRQSIAGVSVDEEMVNLIKYQQAYAASAKMITALDQMLDQLLSIRS